MSKFLERLIALVDGSGRWMFDKDYWFKVIKEADKETLLYLRDNALQRWKLFMKEDYWSAKDLNAIKAAVEKRLADDKFQVINEWFTEHFADLF